MARQRGSIQIEGTLGGIIFYKNKHGYLARTKGGIEKSRIETDPKFARTRETGSEFGYGSRVGKLMRRGVENCVTGSHDGDTNYRLSARVMDAVQADKVGARGLRRINNTNAELLEGFEWRERVKVGTLLRALFRIEVDTDAGVVRCRIDSFIAGRDLRMPNGTVHAELRLAVVRVDHGMDSQVSAYASTGPLKPVAVAGDVVLECAVPAGSGGLLLVGVGVMGFQKVSGELVALKEGTGFVVGKVVVL